MSRPNRRISAQCNSHRDEAKQSRQAEFPPNSKRTGSLEDTQTGGHATPPQPSLPQAAEGPPHRGSATQLNPAQVLWRRRTKRRDKSKAAGVQGAVRKQPLGPVRRGQEPSISKPQSSRRAPATTTDQATATEPATETEPATATAPATETAPNPHAVKYTKSRPRSASGSPSTARVSASSAPT